MFCKSVDNSDLLLPEGSRDVPQLELSQVLWMSNLLENDLWDSEVQTGCLRDTRGVDGRNEASRPATEGLLKTLSDPR